MGVPFGRSEESISATSAASRNLVSTSHQPETCRSVSNRLSLWFNRLRLISRSLMNYVLRKGQLRSTFIIYFVNSM